MTCQCSVQCDRRSSSISRAKAPSTGPALLAMPPRITMNMISPERVQCMKSGVR
jgi:hypothetical protein